MDKSFFGILYTCVLAFVFSNVSAALPTNAVLTIDTGNGCSISSATFGNLTHTGKGSCFGLQLTPSTLLITQTTGHDGLVIGDVQPASGSHQGHIDGSEVPGIDEPWQIFVNTGMHLTTLPLVELGTGTMDFSGWAMTWNGIPHMLLGTGAHNAGFSDGIAQFTCSGTCALGDTYVLEYSATLQPDSSGLGNMPYMVHLEGVISNIELTPVDTDHDGVNNVADACPGTVIPESVPTVRLNPNHWALVDGDNDFDTTSPAGTGPNRSYSMSDTVGCSCDQIIAVLGLNQGHEKFGCNTGVMDGWVALPK
jgi:hypothetical protein